jgi:hypothetical protein
MGFSPIVQPSTFQPSTLRCLEIAGAEARKNAPSIEEDHDVRDQEWCFPAACCNREGT